jgi:putative NADPH-quinone reductase
MTRILVVNGHPDPAPERFAAALCAAYARGATAAGHDVDHVAAGAVPVAFLKTQAQFEAPPPPEIAAVQERFRAAEHVVIVYPLWLGTMPARCKAFLEQLARNRFLLSVAERGWPVQNMKGRSARLVVTMGMPAVAYRLVFGAHSLKGVESGILKISGFRPVRDTLFGAVDASAERRAKMLEKMERLGRKGA